MLFILMEVVNEVTLRNRLREVAEVFLQVQTRRLTYHLLGQECSSTPELSPMLCTGVQCCTVLYSVQGNVILVVTSQCTADHRPARSRTHRPADNHLPAGQSLVTLGPGFTANKFCSLSVNLVNFDLSNTSKQTWCVKHLNGF